MPRLNGIEVIRRLRETIPDTRILVLTMHQEDEYVLQAVRDATGVPVYELPIRPEHVLRGLRARRSDG